MLSGKYCHIMAYQHHWPKYTFQALNSNIKFNYSDCSKMQEKDPSVKCGLGAVNFSLLETVSKTEVLPCAILRLL